MFRGLRSWLGKIGLVLTGTAMLAGTPGCELIPPEGVRMRAPADGIVTGQEEQEIIELMEKEKTVTIEMESGAEADIVVPEGVIEFEGPAQNFVNDQDVFFAKEFERQGLESYLIDDELHIYLTEDNKELKEKYSRCYVGFNEKPDYATAFFCGSNNTVYMPKGLPLPGFSRLAHHEAGHRKCYGDDEMRAIAWETYAMLKSIGLNRKVGSYILGGAKSSLKLPRDEDKFWFESDQQKYHLGHLGFFIFANKHDGNLEKAMVHLMNSPKLNLENEIRETAKRHSSLRESLKQELEKLSAKTGLRKSYAGIDDDEFEELSRYFKVLTYIIASRGDSMDYRNSQWKIGELTNEINNSDDERLNSYLKLEIEELKRKKGEFMKHYEASKPILRMLGEEYLAVPAINPYLRAKVLVSLSSTYVNDKAISLSKVFKDFKLEDKKEVFDLSRKIREINQGLPCDYEFYECPKFVSVPRWGHIDAFFDALRYSDDLLIANLASYDEMIDIGMDFVETFYKDGMMGFEENMDNWGVQTGVAIRGPSITYITGTLFREKMRGSVAQGNEDIYRSHCEMARLMFEYAQAGSCQVIGDQEKQEKCMDSIKRNYWDESQRMIDLLGDCEMPNPDDY